MDKLTRRALLRALAGGALSTVGTVVLARTSLAALGTPEDANPTDLDVQARAAGLDDVGLGSAGGAHAQFINFPGLGFGNGGFRNGGFFNGAVPQRRLPQWRLRQRRLPQWRLPQRRLPQWRRFPQSAASATGRR